MKLIRPTEVTPSVLVTSNVAESEPVYNAATTYAATNVVRGTGGSAHQLFESVAAGNVGHALTDAAWWLPIGATNRWAMFDGAVQSQTTNADSIAVELLMPGRADSLALLNVSGASAQITMTDAIDGVVFDQTYDLVSPGGITDWFAYFFEPIERLSDLVVTDMPPYAGATLDITVEDVGAVAAVGALVVGFGKEIGGTQYGASVGISDYSRKVRDDFGNLTVLERAFSRRATFQIWVRPGYVDQLVTLLASYRATPILYIGDSDYASTAVWGFYKDFSVEIAYPTVSLCSIEVEGLT